MADPQQNTEFPTILGPDASFKGELSFEKGLRLQGRFEGRITTAGRLHVAKEAKLSADVEAGSIIVEGEVKGNLAASDKIELKNSARYEGDLTASKLMVDEGASLSGHVTVGPEAGKPRSSTTVGAGGNAGVNRPLPNVPPPGVQNQNKNDNK